MVTTSVTPSFTLYCNHQTVTEVVTVLLIYYIIYIYKALKSFKPSPSKYLTSQKSFIDGTCLYHLLLSIFLLPHIILSKHLHPTFLLVYGILVVLINFFPIMNLLYRSLVIFLVTQI